MYQLPLCKSKKHKKKLDIQISAKIGYIYIIKLIKSMEKIEIKLGKNFKNFLQKIKPKSSKNLPKKQIMIIQDILFGLVKGQKCFLNTIVKNTQHYKKSLKNFQKWKSKKKLSKVAQIEKLSKYLELDLVRFKKKFIQFIFAKLRLKSFEELKWYSIAQRIFLQWLILHDTTDIQKPFAKKMEKVAQARDWSKHKSWKWYYAEGVVLFLQWRIIPLLLTLFSSKDETDAKNISRKNIDFLKKITVIKHLINIFDRGYDVADFIKEMIKKTELFIIRWIKSRWVICPKYYEEIKPKCTTQTDRKNIFSRVEDFTKEMEFKSITTHKHYEIAFKKVLKKWENADKDIDDVIPVNLVVIRLKKDSDIKWIEEDLKTFQNAWEDFEREFYFYTNLNIETTEDALVIFYLYLKRWKIETWFRYLKQVFWLEKLKLIAFKKLENFCNLLVWASYYLYDKFYDVLNKFESLSENSLEYILKEEEKGKKKAKDSFPLFLLKYYFQYCEQENLSFNPDSFSKFIHGEAWAEIIYYEGVFIESW